MSHLAAPSKEAIKSLYKNMLHSSQSFSSYNFRQYFVRRTEDTFKQLNEEQDSNKLKDLYAEAVKESKVIQRSSIVNQLYGGWKLAIEVPKAPEGNDGIMQRSDN